MVIRLFGRMTAYAFAVETEEGVTFERVVCDAWEREASALHVTAVTVIPGGVKKSTRTLLTLAE